MSKFVSVTLGTIIVVFMYLISLEMILMHYRITTANSFEYSLIDSFENSYFDEDVLDEWIELGEEYNFVVNVSNLSTYTGDEINPCYYIETTYETGISLLGISEETSIKDYAR